MSITALRKAGGKARREVSTTAMVVTTIGTTRFFGFFNDVEKAKAFVDSGEFIGGKFTRTLMPVNDKPLYIFNNRLDSFRGIYSAATECGKCFLKHFSADIENQKLDKKIVELFEGCVNVDALWYLINRYTVIQGR